MSNNRSLGSKTLLTLVLSLLIMAFALAACGGGGAEEAYPGGTGQGGGLETPDTGGALPTVDDPLTDTEGLDTPAAEATEPMAETPMAEESPTVEATEAMEETPQATDMATAEATSETTDGATSEATGEATAIATSEAGEEIDTTDMVVLPASELIGASIVQGMTDGTATDTDASETTDTTDTGDVAGQEATGFVTDVLIDESGAIQYVIADVTAFIETAQFGTPTPDPSVPVTDTVGTGDIIGGGTIAIPWSDLQVHTDMAMDGDDTALTVDDVALSYSGDTAALTAMPVFDTALLDASGPVIGANVEDETLEIPAEFDGLWQVGEYNDFMLMTADGEELGNVEDLLIDLAEGQVVYLVTDVGGFLGIGANSVAIPWESATVLSADTADGDIEPGTLSVDVTAETLENSPTLDLSDWNPQVEENWDAEWREFWGADVTS